MAIHIDQGAILPAARPWYRHLYVQVLVAILLGVVIGHFWPATGEALKPLGDGFIKLVRMIIAPVIFLTIVTGIAGMRDLAAGRPRCAQVLRLLPLLLDSGTDPRPDRRQRRTARAKASTSILPRSILPRSAITPARHMKRQSTGFLLEAIPDTFLSALTAGHILQALLVSILFGVALALVGDKAGKVLDLLNQLSLVMFRLVAIIMAVAPIGAFGAMAFTIGKYGVDSLANLATLVVTFYATSLLFVLVVLGAVARLAGFSIFSLIGYLKAELLLVLGTSSSESALPSLIEKMERAGCPKSIVGLVVPTGYSFNLDGTNIYMTLAALFIAQAVGIELSLGDQLLLLGVAMLSSKGAAGITGAGFITLAATLSIVPSVPVAGMALILGIDRFMSECRSLTNFIGNAVATVVVTRWEGALDKEQFDLALAGKLPSVDRIDPAEIAA